MKQKNKTLVTALMVGLLGACATQASVEPPADKAHTSQNALDWQGVYRGMIPCADCEGIETVLVLKADNTYLHQTRYKGKSSDVSNDSGVFTWSADGRSVTLGQNVQHFQVGENTLVMLDSQGKRITGELAAKYQLAKLPTASITETQWKLIELMGSPIDKTVNAPNITLNSKEKRYSGFGGCNRVMGEYELDEKANRLRFTKGAASMMACIDSLEHQFLQMLEKVDNYFVGNNQLQLNRARMAPLARFEAVYLY
jgi:copper homeostasis protein (lipoprotein)